MLPKKAEDKVFMVPTTYSLSPSPGSSCASNTEIKTTSIIILTSGW